MRAADWLLRAAGRFVRQAPGQHEPRTGIKWFLLNKDFLLFRKRYQVTKIKINYLSISG